MALHILIGTATDDVELIRETSDADHAVDWIVPKDAQLGDDVIFYVQGKGLLGFGVIGQNKGGSPIRRLLSSKKDFPQQKIYDFLLRRIFFA